MTAEGNLDEKDTVNHHEPPTPSILEPPITATMKSASLRHEAESGIETES